MFRFSTYRTPMILLTGLFGLRVAAQVAEYIAPGITPVNFEQWSSGVIDYSILLPVQLSILGAMIFGIVRFPDRNTATNLFKYLRLASIAYFAVMLARLVFALANPGNLSWFRLPVPAGFHLVLASYLFCFSHARLSRSNRSCIRE